MENLDTQELEIKINSLNSAVVTLKITLKDVISEKLKKVLEIQIETYSASLKEMLFELSKRRINSRRGARR
jgi:hypothetical protein